MVKANKNTETVGRYFRLNKDCGDFNTVNINK